MLEKYEDELSEILTKIKEMREKRLAKTYFKYWKKLWKKGKMTKGKGKLKNKK